MPASVEDRMRQLGLTGAIKAPKPVSDRPDNTWKKSDIKAWLDERGVDYDGRASKDHLLDIVEAT